MDTNEVQAFIEKHNGMIPLLPLRDIVVFPKTVIPLFVGRSISVKALQKSERLPNKLIAMVSQKKSELRSPEAKDLYDIGTIGRIIQRFKMPDGTLKVLVEGLYRIRITPNVGKTHIQATVQLLTDTNNDSDELSDLFDLLKQNVKSLAKDNSKVKTDNFKSFVKSTSQNIDAICANLPLLIEEKQQILIETDVVSRCKAAIQLTASLQQRNSLEKKINSKVRTKLEKSQKEYFLNEKIKAIREEMGTDSDEDDEFEAYQKMIEKANLPAHALEKAKRELKKFKNTSPQSPESSVIRNYLDAILQLPWTKQSKINTNLNKARTVLDKAHYGLEDIKQRIIEHIAVQQRTQINSGSIICLVGPPGVGKTSLAESIARATGRQFARMALGGIRDEAEIRGHRRTYIGSMPGRILQKMAQVGTTNPLFLLDEIDKMSMDFRGDPASALLEVLDPEQNCHFSDHYLEIEYDLSNVMFLATSNTMNLPAPLIDRMEIIDLSGYTDPEKIKIAKKYLIPKQFKQNGLKRSELQFTPSSLMSIIHNHTREAGVRNLEREIAKICRKSVTALTLEEATAPIKVNANNLVELLGVPKFKYDLAPTNNRVGQVTGLAWTPSGGDILTIEVANYNGKGKLNYTGKLGDVMKESIEAAMSVVKHMHIALGLEFDVFTKTDFHVHVPEGATPKDGPSAGVAMVLSIASSLTNTPIHANVAMTGEITLRGEVLAVGGLKHKLLAASRSGVKKVLIPIENKRHLVDIPDNIKESLEIVPIRWIEEAISHAFVTMPAAIQIPKTEYSSTNVHH